MEDPLKAVCIYGASSDAIPAKYFEAADRLGALMAENDYTLVFGGGAIGLMGAVARSIHRCGGSVVGVIPEFMMDWGVAYELSDELVVTADMRERKATMELMADAFIALPGGFGTLEEMLEIITLKQLGRMNKPIVFVNVGGFYDCLNATFERMYEQSFAKPEYRELYYLASDPADAIRYLESYQPFGDVRKVYR